MDGDNLFHQGDTVVFDNTATSGNTNVKLVGTLQPGTITVNNTKTGASTYTFSGGGTISGSTSLTKQGDGTLNITNANTYTGTTTVAGGTLLVSNTKGSATGTGDVVVLQGATLGGSGIDRGQRGCERHDLAFGPGFDAGVADNWEGDLGGRRNVCG